MCSLAHLGMSISQGSQDQYPNELYPKGSVTTSEIDLVEEVFGKNIASVKEKTIHQKPRPVVRNIFESIVELVEAREK